MNNSAIERNVRKIVAAFNLGQKVEARHLCEDALKQHPDDPTLNHLYANVCFMSENYEEASKAAERSLSHQASNGPARLLAGRAARALGHFESAEAHFQQLPETNREGTVELARTLDMSGKLQQARAVWGRVLKADPTSREASARLGRLAWEDGRLEEALAMLEFAVSDQAPASAWFDLGLMRQDNGDLNGAVDAFRSALSRNPRDAEVAFNLGSVLQELGEIDEAVAAYRQAYGISQSTLGMIANALTSAPLGRMFLDKNALKAFLGK